jgi:hypothetical protein
VAGFGRGRRTWMMTQFGGFGVGGGGYLHCNRGNWGGG